MTVSDAAVFVRVDFDQPEDRQDLLGLCSEYFLWMDGEIKHLCGFSIPDVVHMSLEDYVRYTIDIGQRIGRAEGGVFLLKNENGKAIAMGGLRRLPDGAAEIVRIFTKPESRGRGSGAAVVGNLLELARSLGYREICLDTGVFMTSAHQIYEAAGFMPCKPYSGAEAPEALQPYWLYMRRSL